MRLSARALAWYDRHGRKDLPWQQPRTPYRVWVSEIMLQQTQVATVIPYFLRFVARFPDVASLAAAPADELMRHWAGLGYYARARNLQRAAQLMCERHAGEVPTDFETLLALPGIGRSTAGAILAQACGQRHAILDGNVRRLLARYHAVPGWPGEAKVAALLWQHAERHLPRRRLADYSQALMDLGATVCSRRPDCARCPLQRECAARAQDAVARFPAPRPRRERPQRHTRMLLLERAQGEILLQRRPPAGIWGGLWCLPELPAGMAVNDFCRERFGLRATESGSLQRVRHGFTHFDLEIEPVRARAAVATRVRAADPGLGWYPLLGELPALPAPVLKLLDRYRHDDRHKEDA